MSSRHRSLMCIAASMLAAASSSAIAESFRCGGALIREGMSATEITAKCGEPDARETVEEPIMARRANGSAFQVGVTTIEFWTYDFGPGRFPARLRIEEGVAKTIELLSRSQGSVTVD